MRPKFIHACFTFSVIFTVGAAGVAVVAVAITVAFVCSGRKARFNEVTGRVVVAGSDGFLIGAVWLVLPVAERLPLVVPVVGRLPLVVFVVGRIPFGPFTRALGLVEGRTTFTLPAAAAAVVALPLGCDEDGPEEYLAMVSELSTSSDEPRSSLAEESSSSFLRRLLKPLIRDATGFLCRRWKYAGFCHADGSC